MCRSRCHRKSTVVVYKQSVRTIEQLLVAVYASVAHCALCMCVCARVLVYWNPRCHALFDEHSDKRQNAVVEQPQQTTHKQRTHFGSGLTWLYTTHFADLAPCRMSVYIYLVRKWFNFMFETKNAHLIHLIKRFFFCFVSFFETSSLLVKNQPMCCDRRNGWSRETSYAQKSLQVMRNHTHTHTLSGGGGGGDGNEIACNMISFCCALNCH